MIMDELWRVLRAGAGLVDRVDAITRLGRAAGTNAPQPVYRALED